MKNRDNTYGLYQKAQQVSSLEAFLNTLSSLMKYLFKRVPSEREFAHHGLHVLVVDAERLGR